MAKENEITSGISWLDTALNIIKKYSVLEIVKAMILLMLLSVTIRICIDPSFIFEAWKEWQTKYHNTELVVRSGKDEMLKDYLTLWIHKYHASRIFIIQYHNGTKDWQHGTMRFEKCATNVVSMKKDYVNFNLTWLDVPFYLKENESFIGNMNDLRLIDQTLYNQLLPYNVDYLACVIIRDDHGDPQGILGCTWAKTDIDISTRSSKIHDYLLEDRGVVKNLIK